MNTAMGGALVAVLAAVLAACGDGRGTVGAAPSRTPQPLPISTPTSIEERCLVPVEGGLTSFPGPDGSTMAGAVLGEGPDAAVFLHQTSRSGFCGFATYAEWAAARGVRAVLVDLCGWGRSTCKGSFAADAEAQVRLLVDWAREHGARRVTVVGASMGGAIALGVGERAGADAVVDLSGPAVWQGVPSATEAARQTTVPLLLAVAARDREMDPAALKAAVESAPARHKRFVPAPGGHGWSMLNDGPLNEPVWTPLATDVLRWIKGDYTAS
jgi:dienelactone hydrolase